MKPHTFRAPPALLWPFAVPLLSAIASSLAMGCGGNLATPESADASALLQDAASSDGSSNPKPPDAPEACGANASWPRPKSPDCRLRADTPYFPRLSKCCTQDADCKTVFYPLDCCGNSFALGIAKSEEALFEATRAGWSCPECTPCAYESPLTEEGIHTDFPVVRCDNGACVTRQPIGN